MLHAHHLHARPLTAAPPDEVVLDYDARQKHRFRTRLASGEELGVLLPRGTVLADGDELETDDGERVRVRAALESLSVVSADEPLLFARLAYHLGNRHVPLQIERGRLRYRHDHVLDDLVRRLGGRVTFESAAFTPEGGAYGHGDTGHHGGHDPHSHDPSHAHPHAHGADDHAHADVSDRDRA